MTKDETDVVQLLIDAGVLTLEDANNIETLKGEALLQRMIDRRVLLPAEIEEAREYIVDALTKTNHTKRMRAKISLVQIITTNLHRRMDDAGVQMHTSREKITAEGYAVVGSAMAVVKARGE
jgi:hypothetical protein